MKTLLNNCLAGKREAQKEFFLRFSPMIYALCRRYAIDNNQAKDYVQDCFIQVFKNLNSYNGEMGNIQSWIYTVSKNTVFQELRKSHHKIKTSPLEHVQLYHADEDIIDQLSQKEILNLIELLPLNHRQILNLYVFEQLSHKEIAELLDIKESSSRSQLTRARNELKKRLQNTKLTTYESKAI